MTTADIITVTINEEERELFMSFGLLNELTHVVIDPSQVTAITLNPDIRNEILQMVLAKRKKSGKVEEAIDIDDVDISMTDVETVLAWTQEHILNFFVRSLRQVEKITKMHEAEVSNLASSLGGSKSLASKKP